MDRKAIANETVAAILAGRYHYQGKEVDFSAKQAYSERNSILITPEEGQAILEKFHPLPKGKGARLAVVAQSTVGAILDLAKEPGEIGVLNFASGKNPGGGFLNGANAQEESLAASSGLYGSLLIHSEYYEANRQCGHMCYTDHGIYSPQVVFFRDERFQLLAEPVLASVLTMPAVNYGQVLLKGEDATSAKEVMQHRMALVLVIFAHFGLKRLILGAYGCGVFRNDPLDVATWWRDLLIDQGYGTLFDEVVFAILDGSKTQHCLKAFENVL